MKSQHSMTHRLAFFLALLYLHVWNPVSAQIDTPSGKRFELSPDCSNSGSFTLASFMRQGNSLAQATTFFEWKDKNVLLLAVDHELTPRNTMFNGSFIDFEVKDPKIIPVDFIFSSYYPLVGTRFIERDEHQAQKSNYKLPIPDLLANCAPKEVVLRSDVADEIIRCEFGDLGLFYRMPAESFFFGYPLRSFVVVLKEGTHQWYTGFVRGELDNGRLSHPTSLVEFKELLPRIPRKAIASRFYLVPLVLRGRNY